MIYSVIDVVSLRHILADPKPKSDSKHISIWENENKQVRYDILNTLTNELFDVYCQNKVAKIYLECNDQEIHNKRCWNPKICHMKS